MAMITTVTLIDDLEGAPTEADETVTFTIDGATYEIDLSAANATKLREALEFFTGSARRISIPRRRSPHRRRSSVQSVPPVPSARPSTVAGISQPERKAHLQAIREWANAVGMECSGHGRIPGPVVAAYNEAH